jgi:hypothetical protein
VEAPIIDVTFGPPAGDTAALSSANHRTLRALFRHPIAHNVEWTDVVALFKAVGTIDEKGHNEIVFGIGGVHHRIRKPHSKDITVEELHEFRRILTQAGWSPNTRAGTDVGSKTLDAESASTTALPDMLVVIDHHEARIYHLDMQSADPREHVVKPYDPHHFLHHLPHKDLSRERGQKAPEDPGFYERLADTLASAGAIVVVGHGAGNSSAADRLVEFLRLHHPETFAKVRNEVVADLSKLTPSQLLVLGRAALTRRRPTVDGP